MKWSLHTLALSIVVGAFAWSAVACSSAGGGGTEPRDATGVERQIQREDALAHRGNWADLYQLTTPRYRAGCSLKGFLQAYPAFFTVWGVDPSQFGSRDVHIAVAGDGARVTSILTYKGADVDAITEDDPDVYTYIDGHWYDDVHGYATCDAGGNGGGAPSPPAASARTTMSFSPPPAPSETPPPTSPPVTATCAPRPTQDAWCDGSFWRTPVHDGLDATATAWAGNRQATGTPANIMQDAVDVVCRSGYLARSAAETYCESCTLHVIIGAGITSADGYDQRAFFFAGGRYLGTDALDASAGIRVVWRDDTTVALGYALYRSSDGFCCPTGGEAVVRFRWDGQRLVALDPIPPEAPGAQTGRY